MRVVCIVIAFALILPLSAQEASPLKDLLEAVHDQPSFDDDCEISAELRAVETRLADSEVARAARAGDFRYLSFPGRIRLATPGILYAFESCPDTSENLKPALPVGPGEGPMCGERMRLLRKAYDFAGVYNTLMKNERGARGIGACTTS